MPEEKIVVIEAEGIGLFSRQSIAKHLRFDPADIQKAYSRNVEALDATKSERRTVKRNSLKTTDGRLVKGTVETTVEKGGSPDWPVRLKASELLLAMAGLKEPQDKPEPPREINLTIVTGDQHVTNQSLSLSSASSDGPRVVAGGGASVPPVDIAAVLSPNDASSDG